MQSDVLVVEDDVAVRGLVVSVLRHEGFTVDVAKDGPDGLAKLRETEYSVVVLDLMMPTVSGFEVLKELEESHPATACVVIISAASNAVIDSLDSPVVVAKLRKPFDIHELVAAARRCSARSHSGPA